jgi:flagellar hook-length control protein FliK
MGRLRIVPPAENGKALQNGRIFAALDFLLALTAPVPPTGPAPGTRSSSNEAPACTAAGAFAAHMLEPDGQTGEPRQALPFFSAPERSSAPPAGSVLGEDAAREPQPAAIAHEPDVTDRRPDPLPRPFKDVQAVAEAVVEGVPALDVSEPQRDAAIKAEDQASQPVEAKATDWSDAGGPEASVVETEPKGRIPTPSPEQLLPPSAVDAIEAGPRLLEPAARPQAHQASTDRAPEAAPAPVVASGTPLTGARQAAARGPELETAAAQGAAGDPTLPPGASQPEPSRVTGARQVRAAPSDGGGIARAVGPQHGPAASDALEGRSQEPLQEPAATDAAPDSQVRTADPSVRQFSTSEAQPGRPLQAAGLHGNAAAAPYAASGISGEVTQLTARASDGAASIEPGPHPATQQVALQVSKALDQDRTEIRIRLDPPELGEVDIQLEFRDLRMTASVSAERADTLELLQRDSRALARALREAGLELADSDLSFAHHGRNDRPDTGSSTQRAINLPHPLPAGASPRDLSLTLPSPHGFVSLSDGRMDLRV